jgi:site-specific DNA-methyltransferase (adenine-specific)
MKTISQVHLIDCMEFMATLPDNFFDLAVVDPPYGIGAGKMTMGSGKHKFSKGKNWDVSPPKKIYWDELFRTSKNQIVWGGNYFTEYLPPSPHWVLWDKKNPNLSFAEGELAWIRSGNNLRIFKHYSVLVENNGKIHPTQKPVALYKWILKNYAKPGDKIFDSHMGSQSSRIAAYDMGFDYWGCEIDKDYFEAGNKRFENFIKQQKIIFPK